MQSIAKAVQKGREVRVAQAQATSCGRGAERFAVAEASGIPQGVHFGLLCASNETIGRS
jgi:hypothetical protein